MLITLTVSHRTDDFTVLEALSRIDTDALSDTLRAHVAVRGAVVVSTCNRFEVYLEANAEGDDAAALVRDELRAQGVAAVGEVHVGRHAAEHLFAVAAGLESVVVGEDEIAGQVRRGHRRAQELGATTSDLERLFQRANETQRIVKRRADVGGANRSVIRLALDLASAQLPSWEEARVLLVGTGNYAGTALKALRDRGVNHIEVWSPSGRQHAFALKHGLEPVDPRDVHVAASLADVIVTCSAGEGYAISADTLLRGRRLGLENRASASVCPVTGAAEPAGQIVIDMGLPRNVEPAVADVPGVQLLDLETVRLHAPVQHLVTTDDARAYVRKAAAVFERVTDENRLAPAVTALRQHVFEALDAEVERIGRRGTEAERRATEAALRHFAGVILHKPSVRARELAASGRHDDYLTGLEALFELEA
ncbi:MAG: glutamyl-tRNA reductase [Agrococcus casei]|uniref:glutamyl-tRNA reductase n=1 Tax=Agrococcus casei TaxID=343512 RepID=UPI003F8FC798